MAVDVVDRGLNKSTNCSKPEARSLSTEPNLALIDYSDSIWVCDSFSSICAAIKDRYIKTNKRFQQVTGADILACIKFEDVGQEELKRKKRRVRFSTGTSISDDSVVHCNGNHQLDDDKESERNVSDDKTESLFLKPETFDVPPYKHLITGENKVYNAYYEDAKTVGYGRGPFSQCCQYNNPFDPRLVFIGLQTELNHKLSKTEVFHEPQTDAFNHALTFEEPAEFVNAYLNYYRYNLEKYDEAAQVLKKTNPDTVNESDFSTSPSEKSDLDKEEQILVGNLENVKYLWPPDESEHTRHAGNETKISEQVEELQEVPFIENGKDISSPSLKIDGDEEETVVPLSINESDSAKPYLDERFIVHTTCLSSDGQSIETLTHETIFKKPTPLFDMTHSRDEIMDDRNTLQQLIDNQESPVDNHDEENDDSDDTLTPGEEETEADTSEPRITYQDEPTNAVVVTDITNENMVYGNRIDSHSPVMTEPDTKVTEMNDCGSEEWCVETHAGHKTETRLSATTEPFVPTCQRRVVQNHPTTDDASTDNYVTVAKQTTPTTRTEPIYQTSKSLPKPATADVPKEPSFFWYPSRSPPRQSQPSDNQVQKPSQCTMVNQPAPQQHPQHMPPRFPQIQQSTANSPDKPTLLQPVRDLLKSMPSMVQEEQPTHRFLPRIQAPGFQKYQQGMIQRHHIPVHTTPRHVQSRDNKKRSNRKSNNGSLHTHSGNSNGHHMSNIQVQQGSQHAHSGNSNGHHISNVQGQQSNQHSHNGNSNGHHMSNVQGQQSNQHAHSGNSNGHHISNVQGQQSNQHSHSGNSNGHHFSNIHGQQSNQHSHGGNNNGHHISNVQGQQSNQHSQRGNSNGHHISNVQGQQSNQHPHRGNSNGHHISNVQGQQSNQQPLYNSFWLQFQNMCSRNFMNNLPFQPFQQNTMQNCMASGANIRPGVPQSQAFNANMQSNNFPMAQASSNNSFPQNAARCNANDDRSFIRPQMACGPMPQLFNQNVGVQAFNNMPAPRFLANAGIGNQVHSARLNNINNNASMNDESEILATVSYSDSTSCVDVNDEADYSTIGVLDSSAFRVTKKGSKNPRPIRSCLVQVV